MSYMFGFFLVLLLVSSGAAVLLTTPAPVLASALRAFIPGAMVVAGLVLSFAGRSGLGIPLILFGATLWGRNAPIRRMGGGAGQKSTVRSAMFEMELDHETGDIDGIALTGAEEGERLSSMDHDTLFDLLDRTIDDPESRALLEAYLDRRFPSWREHTQSDFDPGHGGAPSSGPMTEEEAYQILGLSPGASTKEIREAHRRLMKRIHPDSGGSTFLAAKINEAKDVLLN